MTQPLVSIVIANYNYSAYIGSAIESALEQSHQPVEVIVVDDGSTDASREVIARYPVKTVLQENQGLPAARNNGAALARGEYILFLDSDDILEPDYVGKCLEVLRSATPAVAYVYTPMRYFGARTGIFSSRSFDADALLQNNFVNASALLRRQIFVNAGGFDPAWHFGFEDYELWVRLLSMGYVGKFLDEPLLNYRQHASSMSVGMLRIRSTKQLRWRLRGTYPRLCGWIWWNPVLLPHFLFWTAYVQCGRGLNAFKRRVID